MISVVLAALLLFVGSPTGPPPGAGQAQGRLQWSEPATIVSPNRAWRVEVDPVLTSSENRTPVFLRPYLGTGSWLLFILRRRAELYWSPDSGSLLVINEPVSGSGELLFFRVKTLSEGKQVHPASRINGVVRDMLLRRLGQKRHIVFYLPRFVSWKEGNLVLAVGGTASPTHYGPMVPYCYGFQINSATLHVSRVLSARKLKAEFGAACQISP